MEKTVINNSFWLFSAQATAKAIAFFYTLFLARNLGVENFGFYTVALSYFSLLSTISDFGINRYLIREVSLHKQKTAVLIFNTVVFRIISLSLLLLLFFGFLTIFDSNDLQRTVTLIAVLALAPQALSFTFDGLLIARQQFKLSAIGNIVLGFSTALLGFWLVSKGFSVMGAVLGFLLGQFFYSVFLMSVTIRRGLSKTSIRTNFNLIRDLVLKSLPYGFLGIIGLLYFKIDTLFLVYLKGAFDTGIYGVAYRFLEALVIIPSSVSLAIFPTLTNLSSVNPQNAYSLYMKATKLLFLLSLPIVAIYILILPLIINFYLPQYQPSILVIQILALTIPWLFMIVPQGITILSMNKYLKQVIFISLINLLINISLNILLIPKFSFIGAAWSTVISDVVSFSIMFTFIRKYLFKNA